MGWAESKGTGFQTEIMVLKNYGLPEAKWENDEKNDKFTIVFPYPEEQVGATPQVTDQVALQAEERDKIAKILKFCERPQALKDILKLLGLKHRTFFLNQTLIPLIEKGFLKRTIPDKPKSRFQKYVTNNSRKEK